MTSRTIEETVVFNGPFVLGDFDEVLPDGAYRVEFDEELMQGLSFPAYHRVRAIVHLHPGKTVRGRSRSLAINPAAFDAASARDRASRPVS